MRLEVVHDKFYKALYEVVLSAESWAGDNSYFYQFQEQMKRRSGFVIVAPDGRLAGCISFSDYVPMTNIIIHASIDAKYHRRWVTEDMRSLKPAATHLGSGEEEHTPAPLNRGESEKIKSIHTAPHKGG